jgi:2-octaprenyl-6-methoxyphenol hydroxylase
MRGAPACGIADGTGAAVRGVARKRRDYGQVARDREADDRSPHGGVAYERFTTSGPFALLPKANRYGLVWTMTPQAAANAMEWTRRAISRRASRHFGRDRNGLHERRERKTFPLALELAQPAVRPRTVLSRQCGAIAASDRGQGFNLGLRDAFELAQEINDGAAASRSAATPCSRAMPRATADRYAGVAFTHGLTHIFALDGAIFAWPREACARGARCAAVRETRLHARDAFGSPERAFARLTRRDRASSKRSSIRSGAVTSAQAV